jgi:hypothetical protein
LTSSWFAVSFFPTTPPGQWCSHVAGTLPMVLFGIAILATGD